MAAAPKIGCPVVTYWYVPGRGITLSFVSDISTLVLSLACVRRQSMHVVTRTFSTVRGRLGGSTYSVEPLELR